jgi:hypothetical protein
VANGTKRYSVYLIYWHISTNADTEGAAYPQSFDNLACVEKWKDTYLQDMVDHLSRSPHNQPLTFLRIYNTTLFGSPDDYKRKYRTMPKSYHVLSLDHTDEGLDRFIFNNKSALIAP